MKDLKYIFAYTVPLSAYFTFTATGIGCYTTVFYAFIGIPLLDIFAGQTKTNLSKEKALTQKTKWVFDLMLYLNLPLVFGLLFLALTKIQTTDYAIYELTGIALSAGILLATNAINCSTSTTTGAGNYSA